MIQQNRLRMLREIWGDKKYFDILPKVTGVELDGKDSCIKCNRILDGDVFASQNSNGGYSGLLCLSCATSK